MGHRFRRWRRQNGCETPQRLKQFPGCRRRRPHQHTGRDRSPQYQPHAGRRPSSGGLSVAPCRSRPPGRCSTDLHKARSRPKGKPVYHHFDFRRIVWLPSAALVPAEHPVVPDRPRRPLRHRPAGRIGAWVQPRGRAAPCGSGSSGGTPRMLAASDGARFGRFRIPQANVSVCGVSVLTDAAGNFPSTWSTTAPPLARQASGRDSTSQP